MNYNNANMYTIYFFLQILYQCISVIYLYTFACIHGYIRRLVRINDHSNRLNPLLLYDTIVIA